MRAPQPPKIMSESKVGSKKSTLKQKSSVWSGIYPDATYHLPWIVTILGATGYDTSSIHQVECRSSDGASEVYRRQHWQCTSCRFKVLQCVWSLLFFWWATLSWRQEFQTTIYLRVMEPIRAASDVNTPLDAQHLSPMKERLLKPIYLSSENTTGFILD